MEFAGSRDKVKQQEFIDLLKRVGVEDVSPWEDDLNAPMSGGNTGSPVGGGLMGASAGPIFGAGAVGGPLNYDEPITSDNASKSVDELFYPGMAENTYKQIEQMMKRKQGGEY
tara:strand:- start:303 stop:641 length:339 start_codon:yes stop_codon:yes gene_type:complete